VGLTALDVSHRLRGTIVSVAGGRDEAIRTLAGSNTVAGLAATMISLPSGGEVRLDDLGVVTDTIAECSTFARYNGQPIVAVAVTRAKGASDVVVVLSRPAGWPVCSRDPALPLC
jgi:multidrug efflux pump subunit AcrB